MTIPNWNFQCPRLFSFLVLSLWITKHWLRQTPRNLCKARYSGQIRMVIGRLSEVGWRISWIMCVWLGCTKMSIFGKTWDIMLSKSGKILVLVSAVPIHLVSWCTMSSMGSGCPSKNCNSTLLASRRRKGSAGARNVVPKWLLISCILTADSSQTPVPQTYPTLIVMQRAQNVCIAV